MLHLIAATYLLALPITAAAVLHWGDRADRLAAGAQVFAFAMTLALRALEGERFAYFSAGIMLIDLAVLAAVGWAATRIPRWWIMLTASLLTLPPLGHFARLVDPNLWKGGYWFMTNAPSIGCLALLAIGAVQARCRRMEHAGRSSPRCSDRMNAPSMPPTIF